MPATTAKPKKKADISAAEQGQGSAISWGALLLACGLVLGLTIYPRILIAEDGKAMRDVLWLLMWAMSAGLVRGVGYIPKIKPLRWFLSAPAAYLAFLCAAVLLLVK